MCSLLDFHEPVGTGPEQTDSELWVEVDIEFEETGDGNGDYPSIPPFFTHMALEDPDGAPRVRIRLTATLDVDDYVGEKIEYITQVDVDGAPTQRSEMSRHDRASIEVHYLPARRDPIDHIAFSAASLLGRMLRAADWTNERDKMVHLADELSASMIANAAVAGIGAEVQGAWGTCTRDPSSRILRSPSVAARWRAFFGS